MSQSLKKTFCSHLPLGVMVLKMKPIITMIFLIQNVMPVIGEIPMELSYSNINLFLNLLWTPQESCEGPPGVL